MFLEWVELARSNRPKVKRIEIKETQRFCSTRKENFLLLLFFLFVSIKSIREQLIDFVISLVTTIPNDETNPPILRDKQTSASFSSALIDGAFVSKEKRKSFCFFSTKLRTVRSLGVRSRPNGFQLDLEKSSERTSSDGQRLQELLEQKSLVWKQSQSSRSGSDRFFVVTHRSAHLEQQRRLRQSSRRSIRKSLSKRRFPPESGEQFSAEQLQLVNVQRRFRRENQTWNRRATESSRRRVRFLRSAKPSKVEEKLN